MDMERERRREGRKRGERVDWREVLVRLEQSGPVAELQGSSRD